jgi:hypothetical protein
VGNFGREVTERSTGVNVKMGEIGRKVVKIVIQMIKIMKVEVSERGWKVIIRSSVIGVFDGERLERWREVIKRSNFEIVPSWFTILDGERDEGRGEVVQKLRHFASKVQRCERGRKVVDSLVEFG